MLDKFKKTLFNRTFIILFIITIIRIFLSTNLPTFYIKNLPLDDYLMINQSNSILDGDYLGNYNETTLIKGLTYPFFLAFCYKFNLPYSLTLTIIYILSCIYLTTSLKKTVNKKWLILLYIILLFNPISYSSELFQRIYRNALSLSQTLFFFGIVIRIIKEKNIKKTIFYYLILCLITSLMLLTREDSIWTIITIILVILYKILTNKKYFYLPLIPLFIITINLNTISSINYHYYNTYTYNEINKSSFTKAYIKIMEIKDEEKNSYYSIPKSTLYKLSDISEYFDIPHKELDTLYQSWGDKVGIDNGSIIWAFRDLIYKNKHFYDGMEANTYFENLANEIESLFKEKKLEREKIIPSVLINTPTISDIKRLPNNFFKTLKYISTYKNIKTLNRLSFLKLRNIDWDDNYKFYYTKVIDYHNTENLSKNNIPLFNTINNIYKYFTVIFSIISLLIFTSKLKNLKEEKNYIILLILISYLIIISGVVYTHTTGFIAIRYFYLGPVYLLQNIFIILTLEGVNYEKIKTNYFNALSKRRKNTRKLHNKC